MQGSFKEKLKERATLIRYWGSYFKSPHAVRWIAKDLRPAAGIGWSTFLVCGRPPDDENWIRPIQEIGTKIIYHPRGNGNFDFSCASRVYKLCRRLKPDIFHCDNNHTSPLIGASFARVKVRVWTKHSMEAAFESGRELTLRDKAAVSLRISCLLATKVIAVSNSVKDEVVERGIQSNKIAVLNDAIDKSAVSSQDRGKARLSLGIKDSEIVIATIGHAVPVKGWDILLKAFADISERVKHAKLLLVGSISGDHEKTFANELMGFINERNLGARVYLTGHVPDISKILAASDIFVLPSRSEGWPLALAEGLAASLPCIAAKVGSVPEIIKDGKNGFIFERENVTDLARILLLLSCNPDQIKLLREGAMKSSSKIISMEEYGERLIALYQDMLAKTV